MTTKATQPPEVPVTADGGQRSEGDYREVPAPDEAWVIYDRRDGLPWNVYTTPIGAEDWNHIGPVVRYVRAKEGDSATWEASSHGYSRQCDGLRETVEELRAKLAEAEKCRAVAAKRCTNYEAELEALQGRAEAAEACVRRVRELITVLDKK